MSNVRTSKDLGFFDLNLKAEDSDSDEDFYPTSTKKRGLLESELPEDIEPSEMGFLPRSQLKSFAFALERVDMPELKPFIRFFVSTPRCFVAVSGSWSLYRMTKNTRNGSNCVQNESWTKIGLMEIRSDYNREGIIENSLGHGKAVIQGLLQTGTNFISKNIMMNHSEKKIHIDRIFSDRKGFHTIIQSTELRESWYLGLDMKEAEYSHWFKERKIDAISWGDLIIQNQASEVLISMENELLIGNLKVESKFDENKYIDKGKKVISTISDSYLHKWNLKVVMAFPKGDEILELMVKPRKFLKYGEAAHQIQKQWGKIHTCVSFNKEKNVHHVSQHRLLGNVGPKIPRKPHNCKFFKNECLFF